MESSHRFIIYGAGSIGSVFGGMLARAGHQVSLVGRNPHNVGLNPLSALLDVPYGVLGRETEIDAITGQVIRRSDLLTLPVPVHRVVYEIVKAKVGIARLDDPSTSSGQAERLGDGANLKHSFQCICAQV